MMGHDALGRPGSLWFFSYSFKPVWKVRKGRAAVDIQDLVSVAAELALPRFGFIQAPMLRTENCLNGTRRGASSCIVRANNKPERIEHSSSLTAQKKMQGYLMTHTGGQFSEA